MSLVRSRAIAMPTSQVLGRIGITSHRSFLSFASRIAPHVHGDACRQRLCGIGLPPLFAVSRTVFISKTTAADHEGRTVRFVHFGAEATMPTQRSSLRIVQQQFVPGFEGLCIEDVEASSHVQCCYRDCFPKSIPTLATEIRLGLARGCGISTFEVVDANVNTVQLLGRSRGCSLRCLCSCLKSMCFPTTSPLSGMQLMMLVLSPETVKAPQGRPSGSRKIGEKVLAVSWDCQGRVPATHEGAHFREHIAPGCGGSCRQNP